MSKKYLKVEIIRDTIIQSCNYLLLTDNISGWTFETSYKTTKLYFQNANPFAFITLYINNDNFYDLMKSNNKSFSIKKEESIFTYSIIEL